MSIRYVKIYKRKRDGSLTANVVKKPRKKGKAYKVVKVNLTR